MLAHSVCTQVFLASMILVFLFYWGSLKCPILNPVTSFCLIIWKEKCMLPVPGINASVLWKQHFGVRHVIDRTQYVTYTSYICTIQAAVLVFYIIDPFCTWPYWDPSQKVKPPLEAVRPHLVEMTIFEIEMYLVAAFVYATPTHSHRFDHNNFQSLCQFYAPQPISLAWILTNTENCNCAPGCNLVLCRVRGGQLKASFCQQSVIIKLCFTKQSQKVCSSKRIIEEGEWEQCKRE